MQLEFSRRDKESTLQTLQLVQKDRDSLAAQQGHWEDLRLATQKIETLSNLVERTETEEVAELKRVRDRAKVLEGEHAALQKRYKDQESKITSLERASSSLRQNFAQSQQRCAEWEKKARDYEADVERLTTVVDQAEQTKSQLETDYSFAKLQIDERDSEVRMSKVRFIVYSTYN
jgi:chromosome segregation ATPase